MAVKDAKLIHIESDIKKIQLKSNMYIRSYGTAGAKHLAQEVIQNAFDEAQDPDATGHDIRIVIDTVTDTLSCEDNSRGFNEKDYPMEIFCTTLQSGSKFFREDGGNTSGEYGVGLSVVNALSDEFTIESYRADEGTKHSITFNNGEKKKDKTGKITKSGKQHGTIVRFKPSKRYLGEETVLPVEEIINWIDTLFYLDSASLKKHNIKCVVEVYEGMTLVNRIKFKPQPFVKLLDKISDKSKCTPGIYLGGDKDVEMMSNSLSIKDGEPVLEKKMMTKHIHMDVAFRYEINGIHQVWDTYCNATNTTENGTHKDVVEQVYCRYIQSATNKAMSEAEKKRLKVTWDDIREGLVCTINLSTNIEVGFVGNEKQKIQCPNITEHMTDIIQNGLDEVFEGGDSATLKSIIKLVKLNAKARLEASKTKNATKVAAVDNFKVHQMKNYIPCNNTGKQWKELFIIEGNSAASGIRNACNPDTQAAFLLRGVTFNPFKANLTKTMENREFHDLVTVLKCGIGDKFDINKLYFNRINLFTDADVDGYFISAGVLAFIYKYLRPLIEAGKVFKVYSPLYQLDDKDHPFVANKSEMISMYHDRITKVYKVTVEAAKKPFTKEELREFLSDTYEYRESLIRAAESSGRVNKFLLESIVAHLLLMGFVKWKPSKTNYGEDAGVFEMGDIDKYFSDQKFITALMSRIQKKFPEINVDEKGTFSGVVDGKFCAITISKRFFRKSEDLMHIILEYGYMLHAVNKKSGAEYDLSIGEFLDQCQSLTCKIKTRFKGLGELNASDLRMTTMDINHRISVQFTVEDVERELEIFKITHGDSPEYAEKRKKMMKEYKIKREDLDN